MSESDTRQRMVEAATLLFQSRGYRGTSWRTLVQASKTPWGSIQHHFPGGKEELGLAAVEHGAGLLAQFISSCMTSADSPADGVTAWFDAGARALEASDYQNGCPIAAVAIDVSATESALTAACAAAFEACEGILRTRLREVGVPDGEASSLATTVLACFEGALLLSRSRRDVAPIREASGVMAALVKDAVDVSRRTAVAKK